MSETDLDITMFGEFSLSYKGVVLAEKDYRSQKMWAVLAYLIMNRQRPITQDELIQRFWDDEEGKNPVSALKTLIFRLRKLLIPLLGEEIRPIIATVAAYQWNNEIPCRVDVDDFEALLRKCESGSAASEEKTQWYRQALSLYRGEFLPKATHLTWHTMRSSYYHMQYGQAAYELAGLLEAQGKHEEMMRVCNLALHQGILEEKFFIMLIRGLLHQGNHAQALLQYEKATDILYRELGVARSPDMKSLYREIMDESMNEELDISAILEDVRDHQDDEAFFCEYGFFKEACRMEARRAEQSGAWSHIALLTLFIPEEEAFSKEMSEEAMQALQKVLNIGLRKTDAAARYSNKQFVILLPMTDYDESLKICRCIEEGFRRSRNRKTVEVRSAVRAVEIEGNKGVKL